MHKLSFCQRLPRCYLAVNYRWQEKAAADSAQRAIYHVQCEMEAAYQSHFPDHNLILNRGTLDGGILVNRS